MSMRGSQPEIYWRSSQALEIVGGVLWAGYAKQNMPKMRKGRFCTSTPIWDNANF